MFARILIFSLALAYARSGAAQLTCPDAYGYLEQEAVWNYAHYDASGALLADFELYCKTVEESEEADTLIAYYDVAGRIGFMQNSL